MLIVSIRRLKRSQYIIFNFLMNIQELNLIFNSIFFRLLSLHNGQLYQYLISQGSSIIPAKIGRNTYVTSYCDRFLFKCCLKLPRKKSFFLKILPYKTWWKPRFPMDQRPLVAGHIANFGISLDVFEFLHLDDIFHLKKKKSFFGYSWSTRKPRFQMDQRPLVEGRIANFGIFLDVFEFCVLGYSLSNKTWWKPRFPMDKRPQVEGRIANFGIFLDVFKFLRFG